jgi:hypothetical protein
MRDPWGAHLKAKPSAGRLSTRCCLLAAGCAGGAGTRWIR